ncbi:hypothetical protein [Denitrobaculum tricleocarpae]|uniref:Uncharacterized protein n=1 Tax=Denitrobaculum tricleocarpae TaxID=2591009 RepID=A0A545TWK0_9PROT|nr:hypothetical protein [Denitrobaculum tricleocarpae]TQV81597.1 hypothetical protein FKG95_04915 [Denitrobaculum tricleocarpae]
MGAVTAMVDAVERYSEAEDENDAVVLDLADLLPDDSGDVVLFSGDELPVNISAQEAVMEQGVAEAHVTATGVDVTGLNYYAFENGVTIYSLTDVMITES